MTSAYTANLASFLLTPPIPNISGNSLDDIVKMNQTLCVSNRTNHDAFITKQFPKYSDAKNKKVLRFDSNAEVITAILDAGLTGKALFELYQRDDETCKLVKVGKELKIINAGFATKVDNGSNCTSLISYVLDLHTSEMKNDGFYDRTWRQYL